MVRTLIVSLAAIVLAGCGGTRYVTPTTAPVAVPHEYDSDRRDAVIRALLSKRYSVEDENEAASEITARWASGDRFYRVGIDYAGDIELTYLGSEVEQTEVAPEGMAPAQYVRYMRILRTTIERELGRPMREAATAAEGAKELEERRLAEEKRRQRKVLITSEVGLDDVRTAIAKALRERRYTVEEEDGQVIIARWSRGDRFYRLSLTYNEKEIDLQYLDSDQVTDDRGVEVVDERYIDYMGRLQRSLHDELN
jgi:hypothetical protein